MIDDNFGQFTDTLKYERSATARHRFYIVDARHHNPDRYRWTVCDANRKSGKKTLAKFHAEKDAELFLRLVRSQYINGKRK